MSRKSPKRVSFTNLFLVLACCVAVFVRCSCDSSLESGAVQETKTVVPQEKFKSTVAVSVTDALSGDPINSIAVKVTGVPTFNLASEAAQSSFASTNGVASFAMKNTGAITVEVSSADYTAKAVTANIAEGLNTVNVVLVKADAFTTSKAEQGIDVASEPVPVTNGVTTAPVEVKSDKSNASATSSAKVTIPAGTAVGANISLQVANIDVNKGAKVIPEQQVSNTSKVVPASAAVLQFVGTRSSVSREGSRGINVEFVVNTGVANVGDLLDAYFKNITKNGDVVAGPTGLEVTTNADGKLIVKVTLSDAFFDALKGGDAILISVGKAFTPRPVTLTLTNAKPNAQYIVEVSNAGWYGLYTVKGAQGILPEVPSIDNGKFKFVATHAGVSETKEEVITNNAFTMNAPTAPTGDLVVTVNRQVDTQTPVPAEGYLVRSGTVFGLTDASGKATLVLRTGSASVSVAPRKGDTGEVQNKTTNVPGVLEFTFSTAGQGSNTGTGGGSDQ